jgi:hypothetical protein
MIEFVYARATGNAHLPNGQTIRIAAGYMVPANDPVVAANPDLFSPDPRYCSALFGTVLPAELAGPPVETATAAPGERRNARRPTG